jgi:hypothetical protein
MIKFSSNFQFKKKKAIKKAIKKPLTQTRLKIFHSKQHYLRVFFAIHKQVESIRVTSIPVLTPPQIREYCTLGVRGVGEVQHTRAVVRVRAWR